MSICRFSSYDHQCDVYVYEDVRGGYTTHIARSRYNVSLDGLPELDGTIRTLLNRDRRLAARLDPNDMTPIDLPHAGETIEDDDAEGLLATLTKLREIGYVIPEPVMDEARDLAKECDA